MVGRNYEVFLSKFTNLLAEHAEIKIYQSWLVGTYEHWQWRPLKSNDEQEATTIFLNATGHWKLELTKVCRSSG